MRRSLLLPAAALAAACTPAEKPAMPPIGLSAGRPLVIAHRGASFYAPEHTFAAWDLALRMGADYIEQDLQLTRDGVLVVLHDDTLERTARGDGCAGRVIDRSYDEIRDCSAGAWFNEARPDRADAAFDAERIPSLDDVLRRYAGRARFYIETKNPEEAPGMEEALVALLHAHGLADGGLHDGLPAVIIQSFSAASLRRIAELAPALPRVQLLRAEPPDTLLARITASAQVAHGIGPAARTVDATLIAAAAARDLAVHPYTINDEAAMRRLLALGVHGLFTDRPDVLLRLR